AQFRDAFYSLRTVNNPDPHSFPTRRSSDLIMWGGQEALDYRAEGGGRSIIDKRVDFFRGGWQSRQVERGAADESDLVGGRGGLESLFQKFVLDEIIHARRCGGFPQWLKSPDVVGLVGLGRLLLPWGACVDPLAQGFDRA